MEAEAGHSWHREREDTCLVYMCDLFDFDVCLHICHRAAAAEAIYLFICKHPARQSLRILAIHADFARLHARTLFPSADSMFASGFRAAEH